MIGLVDGDIVCYRCGFAAEKRKKYKLESGETEHVREVEPVNHALQNVDTVIHALKNRFSSLEIYLSGKNNWRIEAATLKPYKGNRSPFGKPVHYNAIRKHLVERYGAVFVDGMEADDALGLKQTSASDTCIVSIDKDLLMIPGLHWNWVKQEETFIKEKDGIRNFYQQCLVGDPTDNIPGIYGIGPKTAAKLLDGVSRELSMWQLVEQEWNRNYPDGFGNATASQACREVASLLWIARAGRERWQPPTREE